MASEGVSSEVESDERHLIASPPHHSEGDDEEEEEEGRVAVGGRRVRTLRCLRRWWKTLVILGTPLLLSPLPLSLHSTESMAAYSIAIIAVYWVTEALPLAVTALLPIWLFPALGVLSARDTASNYLSDTNMLFVGGLMVAVAIEKWNLHKRMALLVLLAVGSSPRWLLLGFMGTTAFLSMWMSNTAVAAMMLAIAHAVLQELEEDRSSFSNGGEPLQSAVKILYAKRYSETSGETSEEVSMEIAGEGSEREGEGEKREGEGGGSEGEGGGREGGGGEKEGEEEHALLLGPRETGKRRSEDSSLARLSRVLVLGVAYAANIGGTATLTGTGPNIVLSGLSVSLFPESGGINFGLWFIFATPAMLLTLLLAWLYLSLLFCDDSFVWVKRKLLKRRRESVHSHRAKRVIKEQYRQLGRIRYAEVAVLTLFVLLALLWLFREPRFIPGWAAVFRSTGGASYFSDSSTAMFVVFLMFIIPSKPPCWPGKGGGNGNETLLDWNTVQKKLAWNVVILLGAGLALSAGAKESGLSSWVGHQLLSLKDLPTPVISLCISIIIAGVTEVVSNVATTTLFLPVLAQLAVELGVNPLYFMIPATVSASYAFMLPVATPPNAMAFSYGYLKVYHMALTGVLMNLLCVGIVTFFLNTTGRLIFHLDTFPSWATNTTSPPVCLQWTHLNLSTTNIP